MVHKLIGLVGDKITRDTWGQIMFPRYGQFPAVLMVCVTLSACNKIAPSSGDQADRSQTKAEQPAIGRDARGTATKEKASSHPALKLNIGKCTRIGNFRETNDDAIDIKRIPDMTICLVADGMGGQRSGEVASKRAIEVISGELRRRIHVDTAADEVKNSIRTAIVLANEEIIRMAALEPEFKNMGTTMVLAVWQKGLSSLFITGVGDSRIYVIRNNHIEQMTVDHSLAQALVEAKTITAEEARTHRFRNVLWKYLGSKEVGDGTEVKAIPIHQHHRILLCTDGLHGVVSDDRIRNVVNQKANVQDCAEALCQLAIDSGSRDNVSCIVIDVVEDQ